MILAVISKFRRSRSPDLLLLLALAAVISLGVCFNRDGSGAWPGAAGECQPELPLEVAWVAEDGASALPDTALTLVMTAKTDLPSVRLELLLPENVSLLSGPAGFHGTLGRGEQRHLGLRVSRNGAAKIQARVTAVTPAGLVFQRGASLDLAGEGGAPARRDPGRVVCSPEGGRQVREFPAQVYGEGQR